MPRDVEPMLCTLVSRPFDRPGRIFEIKWRLARHSRNRGGIGPPVFTQTEVTRRLLPATRRDVSSTWYPGYYRRRSSRVGL